MLKRLLPSMPAVPPRYYAALALAALLNVSPLFFRHLGADLWAYLTWMRCFSEQFWQGDIYPRWCMDVNAGLGTPLFLFYYPLSFYVAALLHPLVATGILSYHGLFALMCFLASFGTALACFSWLRDVAEERYALLAAILFIFVPYQLEMMFFRGAYSEIWDVMWLPLIFKYTRRIARGEHAVPALALAVGLSLFTHLLVTAGALIFSALYLLAMTGWDLKPKLRYGAAVAWGVLLVAFYIVPGEYYHRFIVGLDDSGGLLAWPDRFFSMEFFHLPDLWRPMLAGVMNVLLLAWLCIAVLAGRARIADRFIQREALAWVGISLLALFMVFPASSPVYVLFGPLAEFVPRWRMQRFAAIGIAYLLAVWMQWLASARRRRTWRMDYALALLALWGFSNYLGASLTPAGAELTEKIRADKVMLTPEDHTLWKDGDHWQYEYLRTLLGKDIPKAELINGGQGKVEVRQWNWQGIEIMVDGKKTMTLRVNHSYFPVWHARLYKGPPVHLYPEEKTGLMLVDVPYGEHLVQLTYDVAGADPYLIASQWLSMAAWIALVLMWMVPKIFDKRALP